MRADVLDLAILVRNESARILKEQIAPMAVIPRFANWSNRRVDRLFNCGGDCNVGCVSLVVSYAAPAPVVVYVAPAPAVFAAPAPLWGTLRLHQQFHALHLAPSPIVMECHLPRCKAAEWRSLYRCWLRHRPRPWN